VESVAGVADVAGMDATTSDIVHGELVPAGRDGVAALANAEPSGSAYTPIVSRLDSCTTIREGMLDDLKWIDSLQKKQSRELGFLPWKALEGKIKLGQVLIAMCIGKPAGYLIAADRYMKRDELGLITQMNVDPLYRGQLVAAALLQAQFDRSAYGCKLYSCWCAQDLEANRFWEAMGFTAIAYRSGGKKPVMNDEFGSDECRAESGSDIHHSSIHHSSLPPAPRIHIFWQKRIRPGDTHTPWWYPCKTDGGQMRADRIAFPIPPGVHWRDVEPVEVPMVVDTRHDREGERSAEPISGPEDLEYAETSPAATALPDGRASSRDRVVWPEGIEERDEFLWRNEKRLMTREMIMREQRSSGIWFVPPDAELVQELPEPARIIKPPTPKSTKKPRKPRKPRAKKATGGGPVMTVDPKAIEEQPWLIPLPEAKHDVRRQIRSRQIDPAMFLPKFEAEPQKRLAA
jgi:hypothetical protein